MDSNLSKSISYSDSDLITEVMNVENNNVIKMKNKNDMDKKLPLNEEKLVEKPEKNRELKEPKPNRGNTGGRDPIIMTFKRIKRKRKPGPELWTCILKLT